MAEAAGLRKAGGHGGTAERGARPATATMGTNLGGRKFSDHNNGEFP